MTRIPRPLEQNLLISCQDPFLTGLLVGQRSYHGQRTPAVPESLKVEEKVVYSCQTNRRGLSVHRGVKL